MKSIAFKQRIIGAIFILSLGVILIPVILDTPAEKTYYSDKPRTPGLPEISEVSKINYVFNDIEPVVKKELVHAPKAPEGVKEEVKVASAPTPVPTPKPVPTVMPTPPTPPKAVKPIGDWTIQLGAFSSTDNANELLHRLSKEGFESYLKETPGGKLVRVFVAPGIDKTAAQDLLSKLDAEFGIKGIVVRYREE